MNSVKIPATLPNPSETFLIMASVLCLSRFIERISNALSVGAVAVVLLAQWLLLMPQVRGLNLLNGSYFQIFN